MILSPLRPPLVRPLTHPSPTFWIHSSTDTDFGLPASSCLPYSLPSSCLHFLCFSAIHGFSQSFPDPTSPFYAPHSIITPVPFQSITVLLQLSKQTCHSTPAPFMAGMCVCVYTCDVCVHMWGVCMCVCVHLCVLMLCRPDASLNHFSAFFYILYFYYYY